MLPHRLAVSRTPLVGRRPELKYTAWRLLDDVRLVTSQRSRSRHVSSLTVREKEVASLVGHGCTNREICAELVITQRTVETHVSNICAKLGFRSRTQVAVWAAQHGLVRGATPAFV